MAFCVARRRFSVQRCARCHLGISASEMVMRARDLVYHLNCFTCTTCSKMLTTGDHFGMKDSLVYCRLHFETLIQGDYQTHFNHTDVVPHKGLGPANTLGLSYFNGVGTVQKGRPRKRKSPGPGAELAAYNAGKGDTWGALKKKKKKYNNLCGESGLFNLSSSQSKISQRNKYIYSLIHLYFNLNDILFRCKTC